MNKARPSIQTTRAFLVHALSLTCSIAPFFGTTAQIQALPIGNAKWVDGFWIGPGYPYTGWSYTMNTAEEDTLVNGIAYERVISSSAYAVRDNMLGQVYFLADGDVGERLLYDFDVTVGDTIRYDNGGMFYFDSLDVVSVDTVVVNGTERRRIGVNYEFGSNYALQYWIQGIGSDGGLFNPCQGPSVSGTSWLACMSLDGVVQYGNNVGEVFNCDVYLGSEGASKTLRSLAISPNPGRSLLRVQCVFSSNAPALLRVYDAQGSKTGEWVMDRGEIMLNSGSWPSGLYTIECATGMRPPLRAKWIKE